MVYQATVVLTGSSNIGGTVTFEQATKNGPVTVTGDLQNLDPSSLRGFHIHQTGDLTNGCASAGSHFNPFGKNHGAPSATERHVGDLGNIESDSDGVAKFTIEDKLLTLNGPNSIIGRSVVLHAGTDDLGRGDNEESLKTGNAGARSACGVIGISP
ncbi:Copper/Zinc superoxide dismutase [Dentipellis sp. KUC8613]|nr:Copper/Zinc superoxide dismutase [Dentipellis sp. KUC8613]